ncbi:hypothetical protein J2Z44_001580 [Clostridium punense]|uniref:Uncharacterized protein n=1 Tax=Clostridium punense TaxID=1054297 RepID=A0ABS4K553_9CLOT|nr:MULTISPECIES: hypothetical protein [Clostridium]EQB87788.1 hypothetical protein M918_07440 [Clostridium sp. BL8]MBP2021784.1 hypothetical protein [Clostridium punense]
MAAFFSFFNVISYSLSDGQVEIRARKMGMKYPEEIRVMIKDEVK